MDRNKDVLIGDRLIVGIPHLRKIERQKFFNHGCTIGGVVNGYLIKVQTATALNISQFSFLDLEGKGIIPHHFSFQCKGGHIKI